MLMKLNWKIALGFVFALFWFRCISCGQYLKVSQLQERPLIIHYIFIFLTKKVAIDCKRITLLKRHGIQFTDFVFVEILLDELGRLRWTCICDPNPREPQNYTPVINCSTSCDCALGKATLLIIFLQIIFNSHVKLMIS